MGVSWHNPISSPGEERRVLPHKSAVISSIFLFPYLICVVPPSTSFSHMYLDHIFVRCAPTFLRILLFITSHATHVISLLPIPNILWMPGHGTWLVFSRSRSFHRLMVLRESRQDKCIEGPCTGIHAGSCISSCQKGHEERYPCWEEGGHL
jgi:hypothetical protein